jgi:enamine deaminase RidA (YjgF/YER057c/UK114 family)
MLSRTMLRLILASFSAFLVLSLEAPTAFAQIGAGDKTPVIRPPKKDKKVEQVLADLPQPPLVISADATRLSFLTSPLMSGGLLSHQTHEALRWLIAHAGGGQIVRVRGFVAGTGDLRRVPQIVSEVFTERHEPLPVVTVLQAGALPLEGAQVVVEATIQQGHSVNPNGLNFGTTEAPTAEAALAQLRGSGELAQATCFVPSLEGRAPIEGVDMIQPQRLSTRTIATCEGVTRPNGAGSVGGAVLFTGAQMAFSYSAEDASLAFERLQKTLKGAGSSLESAVVLNYYPLSGQLHDLAEKVSQAYLKGAHPAGLHGVIFEALPSIDASFAIEAVTKLQN